jgi:hypothetical protein
MLECSQIVQGCIDGIQEAKENEDAVQVTLAAVQCNNAWITAGCSEMIADIIESAQVDAGE